MVVGCHQWQSVSRLALPLLFEQQDLTPHTARRTNSHLISGYPLLSALAQAVTVWL